MRYHSTRNKARFVDSAQAVLEGLAPDGGLYMPEAIPSFDWEQCLNGSSKEMSRRILSAFLPEIPEMDKLVHRAKHFSSGSIPSFFTHILIEFRQYLFRFSNEKFYIFDTVQRSIILCILNCLWHDLHAVHLLCLLR